MVAVGLLVLGAQTATAQSTLGELLDAGASKLTADQFKEEIVQRVLVGRTPTDYDMEVMHSQNGTYFGNTQFQSGNKQLRLNLAGSWTLDADGKVCTQGRVGITTLPLRCQFWFKLGDRYFVSDSDWDRSARVLSRTVQP